MSTTFALCVLVARPAAADMITLNFTGLWAFYDSLGEVPQFDETMAAYGVTRPSNGNSQTASPLSFSITFDDLAAPGTPFPGSSVISFIDAVQYVNFTVGSLSLGCEGIGCRPTTNGSSETLVGGAFPTEFRSGPSMRGLPSIGNNFIPSFFSLTANLPSISTPSLSAVLADPGAWLSTELLIDFSGGPAGYSSGYSFNGRSTPLTFVRKTVTPVQVPEPKTILFVTIAFLLMLWKARRRGRKLASARAS